MPLPLYQATYKFIVEGIIKQINAENILEIGLGQEAYTAKVCLDHIKSRGSGKYVVIDFNPLPEAMTILHSYDKKTWELRIGDTTKDDKLFQDCHDNRFDLILIDGSHWITHVISDIQKVVCFGCAKNDSIFVFHDTNGSHVRQAIVEAAKAFNIQTFDIPKANLTLGHFKNT